MEDYTLSRPMQENGKIMLIYKNYEQGIRTRTIFEVEDQIRLKIKGEKLEQMKANLIQKLKRKYPIENKIDYSKYMNN